MKLKQTWWCFPTILHSIYQHYLDAFVAQIFAKAIAELSVFNLFAQVIFVDLNEGYL